MRIKSPYRCFCGKYQGKKYLGVVCDKCGVEVKHYQEHLKKFREDIKKASQQIREKVRELGLEV